MEPQSLLLWSQELTISIYIISLYNFHPPPTSYFFKTEFNFHEPIKQSILN